MLRVVDFPRLAVACQHGGDFRTHLPGRGISHMYMYVQDIFTLRSRTWRDPSKVNFNPACLFPFGWHALALPDRLAASASALLSCIPVLQCLARVQDADANASAPTASEDTETIRSDRQTRQGRAQGGTCRPLLPTDYMYGTSRPIPFHPCNNHMYMYVLLCSS